MAGAVFGIQSLPTGITEPEDCAIQSIDIEETVDRSSYRNKEGVTIALVPHKLKTISATVNLKGKVALTGVAAGAFTEGTLKVVSSKFGETVDDVPSSTIAYKAYESVETEGGDE